MCSIKKRFLIFCEGKSERNYIQKLNRYLDDNGYNFVLTPIVIGCGHCNAVYKKYKEEKKKNKNEKKEIMKIWVDWDTYARNDKGDYVKYEKLKDKMPEFLFSHHNFEDFLALHLNETQLLNWQEICNRKDHIKHPLKEIEYLDIFKKYLFADYEKGNLPITINEITLTYLFQNNRNKNIFFKCQFAEWIENLMNQSEKNN